MCIFQDRGWIAPFELDGHRWPSVEHYFQAYKRRYTDPEWFRGFTIRADGKYISVEEAKKRGRNLVADPTAFKHARMKIVMRRALRAKFNANWECKVCLSLTTPAELLYTNGKGYLVPFTDLMHVRSEIWGLYPQGELARST